MVTTITQLIRIGRSSFVQMFSLSWITPCEINTHPSHNREPYQIYHTTPSFEYMSPDQAPGAADPGTKNIGFPKLDTVEMKRAEMAPRSPDHFARPKIPCNAA